MFRTLLRWKIRKLAQLTIWRYRPGIVGVTGSVGKTTTRAAIFAILSAERNVRSTGGNLNNDFGLPLTILGDWSEKQIALVSRAGPPGKRIRKALFWSRVILTAVRKIIVKSDYPEILILEYGVDRPGDMKYLLDIARPNISVISAIGEVPVHVEFFSGPDELAREKGKLIDYLPVAGFAILNSDDETVMKLKSRTRGHVLTFGFGREAEFRITNFENTGEGKMPSGVAFKLGHAGRHIPVRLTGALGRAQAYAAAAGAAVGIVFGMNLVKISEALKSYRPVSGRMRVIPGVKDTYILDDTYNASPLSMRAALDTLEHVPARRRIAVLGDMLELGRYSMDEHEELGKIAAGVADVLVTIGPRARFIAEGAQKKNFSKKQLMSFDVADEARKPVQSLLRKGDVVLVKASRAMGLEVIVEEIKSL